MSIGCVCVCVCVCVSVCVCVCMCVCVCVWLVGWIGFAWYLFAGVPLGSVVRGLGADGLDLCVSLFALSDCISSLGVGRVDVLTPPVSFYLCVVVFVIC
jgi:hypothetical protein